MPSLFGLGSSTDAGSNADRLGRLRVLVIGNPGSGKTALAHLIANGKPLGKTTPTVGCNTFVKLVSYQEGGGNSAAGDRQQSYFVELWDVGTHERYKALRSVFYTQLNGVIFVHELANGRSTAGLGRWASEVARQGSFAAPLPEHQAAAALGALPVPYLTIANKADLAGQKGPRRRSPLLCWLDGLLNPLAIRNWLASLLRRGGGSEAGRGKLLTAPSLADMAEAGRAGTAGTMLTASATEGRIDMHAVGAFFQELIERRYYSATRTASTLHASAGLLSQGSMQMGGPPPPISMGGSGGSSLFGGGGSTSGPASNGSRLTHSNTSLNPASTLGLNGYRTDGNFDGSNFMYQNGSAQNHGSITDRLSQLNSSRIDDLDF